jgi:hypothetical protein
VKQITVVVRKKDETIACVIHGLRREIDAGFSKAFLGGVEIVHHDGEMADAGVQDGQEKAYDLPYGVDPIRLPGRAEQLWRVVVAGFEAPLMLLTNLPIAARDSQSLSSNRATAWTTSA